MSALSQTIIELAISQVNFKNEALETAIETAFTKFAAVFQAAQAVDAAAAAGDETVVAVSAGVLKLAGAFGTTFPRLTADQKTEVKETVASIVTGANETQVETLFNTAVEFIGSVEDLNTAADSEEAPEDEDGEDEEPVDGEE